MFGNSYISGEILSDVYFQRDILESRAIKYDYMPNDYMKGNYQEEEIPVVDWHQYTFLVADDEELNLEFIEEVLSETGAKLIMANNGKEAIDKYNENPNIKVVLLDIRMPIMDGYGAMKEIRNSNKKIPIIAQTAFALTEDKLKALSMGFTDYLEKPIEQMTIIQTIKKYL